MTCVEMTSRDWHVRMAGLLGAYYNPQTDAPLPDAADQNLRDPIFLQGLSHFTIAHKPFENFITRLRHALLLAGLSDGLAEAIACYAFNTEYILDVTPAETALLGKLHNDKAALLACYAPLHVRDDAAEIRKILGDTVLARQQIDQPLALEKRRAGIESVTDIGAGVSLLVRAQYEESPYPRWRDAPKPSFDADIQKRLPPQPSILIAGCGTGQETAQLALALPEAEILAVDLSRASLAYAMEQAERLGIRNVTFRQGDILRLGTLAQRFDYISSQGVLHHMEDPLAGWHILAGLLKPQGVLSLGLYSEIGRRHIVATHKAIAQHGFASTPEGIRNFRRRANEILPENVVKELQSPNDYYSLSMCRDLLFHVQEHRFDIPRIAAAIKTLGLSFLKFNSPFTPPAGDTLLHWHAHEEANPLIFRNMYKFWCAKGL